MNAKLTRKEQKERTRSGLITAARRLFVVNGIATTSTADVAKAMKLSHGAVFVHFQTRDELIMSVIDDFGNRLSQEFNARIKGENVESVLEAHLAVLTEYEDFYFRLVSEMNSLPPKVRSMIFMLNAAVSWRLHETAQPLIERGKIKKLTRPELFNTWMSLVNYHLVNRELFSDSLPILKVKGAELLKLYMNLIKGENQ